MQFIGIDTRVSPQQKEVQADIRSMTGFLLPTTFNTSSTPTFIGLDVVHKF